jgi:protein gp37
MLLFKDRLNTLDRHELTDAAIEAPQAPPVNSAAAVRRIEPPPVRAVAQMNGHSVTDWRDNFESAGGRTSTRTFLAGPPPTRVAPPAWYDVTWNPTAGCSPAGPACDCCDAMRIVAQLARMSGKGGARYDGLTTPSRSGPVWSGELRVRDDLLTWPLAQRKPRRILVGSLSDLFHEGLATEVVDAVHAVIRLAHWHRFLVQTRRAERMRAYYADPQTPQRIAAEAERLATEVLPALGLPLDDCTGDRTADLASRLGARRKRAAGVARVVPRDPAVSSVQPSSAVFHAWPLSNLGLGVAVEDQARAGRIGELLQIPAALRWACFEPLLGAVRTDRVPLADGAYVDALSGCCFDIDGRGLVPAIDAPTLPPLDWVIAGGETGISARPTHPDWVRDLRDRCAVTGVPFYFKQWGEWGPASEEGWGHRMVRCGRRAAGRVIDGRSWDEIPPVVRKRIRQRR